MLVARRALALDRRASWTPSPARCARAGRRAPRTRDGRAHAAPAGAADHLRPQGGRLARGRPRRAPTGCAARAARGASSAARPARSPRSATTGCACSRLLADRARARRAVLPVAHGARPGRRARRRAGARGRQRSRRSPHDVVAAGADRGRRGGRAGGGGRGGSSTLPHKRNPVGSALAIACARRRAAAWPSSCSARWRRSTSAPPGAWQAEWEALERRARRTRAARPRRCARRSRASRSARAHAREPRRHRRAAARRGGEHGAGRATSGAPRGPRARRGRLAAGRRGRRALRDELLARTRRSPAAVRRGDRRARSTRPPTSARPTRSSTARSPAYRGGRDDAPTLHHRLDGPEDAPVARALQLARHDARDVGRPGRRRSPSASACCATTTRGHGRSPVAAGPYAIADLGRDVLALLDASGIERVAFCGLSLGGMIGMWLAVNAPGADRPAGAVLHLRPHAAAPSRGTSAPRTVRARGHGGRRRRRLERWFTPGCAARAARGAWRGSRQMLLDTPPEGYAACCEAIARHGPARGARRRSRRRRS